MKQTPMKCTLIRIAWIACTLSTATVGASPRRMAIVPFSSVSIEDEQILVLTSTLSRECAALDIPVVDDVSVKEALRQADCFDREKRSSTVCLEVLGSMVDAEVLCAGQINRIGSLYELRVVCYDIENRTSFWKRKYSLQGSLEQFYQAVVDRLPARLAEALGKTIPAAVEPSVGVVTPEPVVPVEPVAVDQSSSHKEDSSVVVGEPIQEMEPPEPIPSLSAPLVGIKVLSVVQSPQETQTPVSGNAWVALPLRTEGRSLRLEVGVPLYHNQDAFYDNDKVFPDVFGGIVHKWSFPRFGVGLGLLGTYMSRFNADFEDDVYIYSNGVSARYSGDALYAEYGDWVSVNLQLDIRGGRPMGGFFGHISWPLPFYLSDDNPRNYIIEYSAYGVFGRNKVKCGFGMEGAFKRRDADAVVLKPTGQRYEYETDEYDTWNNTPYSASTSYDDFDDEMTTLSEFYFLLPSMKLAVLFGNHIVACFNLELGGTILPRSMFPFVPIDSKWSPMVGLDIVFSLGKLTHPTLYSGRF